MAKLLGKADSTIAAAALKAGMADVMPDYSELYKEKAKNLKENYETFQTTIENFFDGLTAETSALGDELKEAVTTTMADLSTGSTPDEQGIELFDSYFNGLKQKLKSTKVGKEGEVERAKIRAEMNRVKNSTSGMAETLIDLGVRIENGDFNANAMGKDRLDVLKAINDKTAKREIVNGNLVYSMPGSDKKITQDDLRKILVSNDPEVSKAVNNVTVGALTTGKTYGTEWQKERQAVVNDYKEGFTTKEALSFEMHKPQGNLKYSWAEYLAGKGDKKYNMQIWASLRDAGLEGIPEDKNGDGKITELDFANAENGIAMIKRLTQISEDGFNLGITKQVYSEFLADTVAKKEFDDGKTLLNRTRGKGKVSSEQGITDLLPSVPDGKSIKLGFYASGAMVPVRKSDAVSVMENIQAGLPFGVGEPRKFYSYVNGNWYENFKEGDNEESESFVGSVKNLVANALGTSNNKDFMNLTTTVAPASTVSTNLTVDNNGVVIEQPADVKAQENIFKQLSIASNDDDAADGLNKALGLTDRRTDGKQPYMFMPWFAAAPFMPNQKIAKGEMGTGILSSDAAESDDLMLYNARTGEVIMDSATGERRRFKSGDAIADFNSQTGSAEAKEIIDLLTELGIYSDSGANSGVGSKYPVKKDKSE